MKKFITVAGNIGVGKSTLVELICKELGWQPFFEPVTHNPYLSDFYGDMDSWSFHSQIFFLTHRLRNHKELERAEGSIIQDRSIYEDAEIFAKNLYLQGHFNQRDYETYESLYQTMSEFLVAPDLVIYLRASVGTLTRRIKQRSRVYEQTINPDYLQQLNKLYESWISSFSICPVLTIPADDLDFVKHPKHLQLVIRKIQEKLTGKDEVTFTQSEVSES